MRHFTGVETLRPEAIGDLPRENCTFGGICGPMSALNAAFATMIRCLLLALFSLAVSPVLASGPLTLRDGEQLVYRVSWGLFPHAGSIRVLALHEELAGLPQTRVITETATRGVIRRLYPFTGRVDSIFDYRTGRMLAAYAMTSAGRKQTQASIVFNYAEGIGNYVDALRPERSTEVEIPTEFPMDLITSLINARTWDIKLGEKRNISVLFDDEFYDLTVTAERIEEISTAQGRQRALLLVPRMEGQPRGMFKRGGSVRVWLSLEEPRLPLRLEVSLAVGTATAVLTEYQPPRTEVLAQHANPGP